MELRERATGQIITDAQFRALYSNTSFPSTIDYGVWGYDVVFEGPQATGGTVYQYSMRQGVEQVEGIWYTKYVLGPIFDNPEDEAAYQAQMDEGQAQAVRATRNALLAGCDWTQMADTPLDDATKATWATYRQALRDVSSQAGFPWTVEWPAEPG
jgi:hypothetical protein